MVSGGGRGGPRSVAEGEENEQSYGAAGPELHVGPCSGRLQTNWLVVTRLVKLSSQAPLRAGRRGQSAALGGNRKPS